MRSYTARCYYHGYACNKSLNLGAVFTEAQARVRIKQWCLRGLSIPSTLDQEKNARILHCRDEPRYYPEPEFTEQELDAQILVKQQEILASGIYVAGDEESDN